MPYSWHHDKNDDVRTLRLWAHQSLRRGGFVAFISLSAALMALPLLAALGSPALWVLLLFAVAVMMAIWWALRRNARDLQVTEELTLTANRITLIRRGPHGAVKSWGSNPHWVRVTLYPKGGPVQNYLTLTGNGREVELGPFLTVGERQTLAGELDAKLANLRSP